MTKGETLEFKGAPTNTTFAYDSNTTSCVYLQLNVTSSATTKVKYKVSGDITTLLDGTGGIKDLTGRDYCFANFGFTGADKLEIDCSELKLPSTTLATGCYYNMFGRYGVSLKSAPELPATSLANSCYDSMFSGCSSLDYVKASVKDDELVSNKSGNWLSGVSATGTFESTDSSFDTAIARSGSTIPEGWTLTKPEPETGLYLNTKKVNFLFINGKQVAELYLNGKQVGYEAPEPPGPDPKLTNFRITNIGNATDNPGDNFSVDVLLPPECDMQVYNSSTGSEYALTPGEFNTLTIPYG